MARRATRRRAPSIGTESVATLYERVARAVSAVPARLLETRQRYRLLHSLETACQQLFNHRIRATAWVRCVVERARSPPLDEVRAPTTTRPDARLSYV